MIRKFAVEFLGTAILVFFAVGVATLMFGFRLAAPASRREWWPPRWRSA
ncbi:MAG: hypothetical protein ACRDOD_02320 [Streptosporangiaceae bacterium]